MQAFRRLVAAALLTACADTSADDEAGTDGTGTDPTSTSADDPASDDAASDDAVSDVDTGNDDASSTTPSTTEPSDDTTADTTGGGPFELEVHTELTGDGGIALLCNLPPAIADCMAIAGAPCDDADDDGLADAWEDAALERLRPLRRLDEAEPLLTDDTAALGDVGRVVAVGDRYRIFVMLGFSSDYGSCGFTAHNGDSERIALDLEPYPEGGVGGVRVSSAYTAAHENTTSDHGRVFAGADLEELVYDLDPVLREPRWVVFSSSAKHATYASVPICEGISAVPCLDEDCGPDGVDDPAAFDRLPMVVNAGEEAAPRVTELSVVGFPGDEAWAEQDFCGGLGGSGCSSPVREKLLVDPF